MNVFFDGNFIDGNQLPLHADNRALRYGDGLFETMKSRDGKTLLFDLHLDRLMSGVGLLQFSWPRVYTSHFLAETINVLCRKNNCTPNARIRLQVTRGESGLYEPGRDLHLMIQCWPLEGSDKLNEKGLSIDIYPEARKSTDKFANLKSCNYLPYLMAAKYAGQNGFDDCLVLNTHNRICDATIANIFCVSDGQIITPPLSEGCVAGIMRRYLLEQLPKAGYKVREEPIAVDQLSSVDEIFLTNATSGARWVQQYKGKKYTNEITGKIYRDIIQKR
jgi:branched-chain amino acid aminotransferase